MSEHPPGNSQDRDPNQPQLPDGGHDDTAPIAPRPQEPQQSQPRGAPSIFRYSDGTGGTGGAGGTWDTGDTRAHPTPYGYPGTQHDAMLDQRRGNRRWGAGILAGALVLGALAGVGGAAGYNAVAGGGGRSTSVTRTALVTGADANAATANAGSDAVEKVSSSVLPSVVKINVRGPQGEGSGSGIILSSNGEILTNNHVAEVAGSGAGSMVVSFNDGTSAPAVVVGTDPVTDIAVIKAKGVQGLTPATFGSSDALKVGQQVVAVGSPFGLEATVTSGIVSALGRPVSVSTSESDSSSNSTTYPAIQTDAAINPGNSGGPLLDMAGQVVGINSSIRTSTDSSMFGGQGGSIGLGFAIPIDEISPIINELRHGQTATHARLGVTVSDASGQDGLVTGAKVGQVSSGTGASAAGLQSGDVITKVDDQLVSGSSSLVATIRGYRPGDQVTLTVLRGGQSQQIQATLGSDATGT